MNVRFLFEKTPAIAKLVAVLTLFCRSEEFAPHRLRKPRRLHGGPWPLQLEVGVNGAGLAGVYCLLVALLEVAGTPVNPCDMSRSFSFSFELVLRRVWEENSRSLLVMGV